MLFDFTNANAQFTLDVVRPSMVAERKVVSGFERFFSLSDFGYGDVEGQPLNSVLIQIPDASLGSLRLGTGDFSTDNGVELVPSASTDYNSVNIFEITRSKF